MKKHIANVITSSRILVSLHLLCIPLSSVWFYIVYLFCGFTDMIDGTIARKTGVASNFGAKLDTIADFTFMFVCALKILPVIHIAIWLWVWIIIIALMKIFNASLVLIQKKKLISIHSVLNKVTGFTLFLFPLALNFVKITYSVSTICLLATIATMQEVCFVMKGQDVL